MEEEKMNSLKPRLKDYLLEHLTVAETPTENQFGSLVKKWSTTMEEHEWEISYNLKAYVTLAKKVFVEVRAEHEEKEEKKRLREESAKLSRERKKSKLDLRQGIFLSYQYILTSKNSVSGKKVSEESDGGSNDSALERISVLEQRYEELAKRHDELAKAVTKAFATERESAHKVVNAVYRLFDKHNGLEEAFMRKGRIELEEFKSKYASTVSGLSYFLISNSL